MSMDYNEAKVESERSIRKLLSKGEKMETCTGLGIGDKKRNGQIWKVLGVELIEIAGTLAVEDGRKTGILIFGV